MARRGGVRLHMAHVAGHLVAPEGFDHVGDRRRAGLAGGDLGLEIADVALGRAAGPGSGGESGARLRVEEEAAAQDRQGVEQHAFFLDRA